MFREVLSERERNALVEQDPHSDRNSGGLNTSSSVLEDGVNLLASDAGKPFQELINRSAAFEILEQGAHRDAGAAKYPRAADLERIALYGLASRPIQHGDTLL